MKTECLCLILCSFAACAADQAVPAASPAAPPAAPVKRSAADLEKLVAPIALYPDSLIATILPASVYPLEIVQAARFVANTNNLAKLDEQPWDENVKAVAQVPEVIKKMNDDLAWTMELGEAFLAQDKDVMDAMQSLRAKAQQVGTLKTTPQQVVTVTNTVIEKTVEQKVVVVTNTIVQIQPANPQVVYVPTYNPAVVYYPPPPTYVGPPPVVSFAAGVAVGAIIANNCDWHYGGCYRGDVDIDIDIDRNVNVDRNANVNRNANVSSTSAARASSTGAQRKWQPDQSRLSKSGTPSASASTTSKQARGWSSGAAGPSTTAATGAAAAGGAGSAGRSAPSTGPSRSSASPSVSPTTRDSSSRSAFSGASSGGRASAASSRGASSRSSPGRSGSGFGAGRS